MTAASAAAASLGRSLTERGATDRLMLATATCRPGDPDPDPDPDPDCTCMIAPGTTLAIHFGVMRAPALVALMIARGVPRHLEVEIVSHASTLRGTIVRTTLADLARIMVERRVSNPSMISVRWSKSKAQAVRMIA